MIHVAACLGCGFIAASLSALAAELIRREIPKPSITPNVMIYFFLAKLNNNIVFYGAILALAHVVKNAKIRGVHPYAARFRCRQP